MRHTRGARKRRAPSTLLLSLPASPRAVSPLAVSRIPAKATIGLLFLQTPSSHAPRPKTACTPFLFWVTCWQDSKIPGLSLSPSSLILHCPGLIQCFHWGTVSSLVTSFTTSLGSLIGRSKWGWVRERRGSRKPHPPSCGTPGKGRAAGIGDSPRTGAPSRGEGARGWVGRGDLCLNAIGHGFGTWLAAFNRSHIYSPSPGDTGTLPASWALSKSSLCKSAGLGVWGALLWNEAAVFLS